MLKVRSTGDVGVASEPEPQNDDPLLRFAMLSVYYASLGRQFEIRGAPSVLLPPQVRPLELGDALDLLSASPSRLREALWLVVRGVRWQGLPSIRTESYPSELVRYLRPGSLEIFAQLRRQYRQDANVFAAALVACRDDFRSQFTELCGVWAKEAEKRPGGFSAVTDLLIGMPGSNYLERMIPDAEWAAARGELDRLESDVGLNVYDFVEELADAAAFQQFCADYLLERPPATSLTVFPVSSVIRQDSRTLVTNATVTTLVRGDFDALSRVADPQRWSSSSDVIRRARYVADAFERVPLTVDQRPTVGAGFEGTRLLDEKAVLSWGKQDDQQGHFTNVLNIQHAVGGPEHKPQSIEVRFSLRRSIDSGVLWDRRAGGLQLNQGYLKVRPVGPDAWRVTTRKVLRFSDRTPGVGGRDWFDFGQMLNYLAPAALTWWVESETYSLADPAPTGAGSQPAPEPAYDEGVP